MLKKTKLERVESMFSSNTEGVGSTTSYRILKLTQVHLGSNFQHHRIKTLKFTWIYWTL